MLVYLIVAIGGAIGTVLRAAISAWGPGVFGTALPWATILINIVGSFVIGYAGMLTASDSRFAASPELRAFILVGLCGGFTTFSSFSQQTVDLLRDGRMLAAFANVALSMMLCFAATAAGYALASATRTSTIASRPVWLGGEIHVLATTHDPAQTPATLAAIDNLPLPALAHVDLLAIDTGAFPATEALDALIATKDRKAFIDLRSKWVGNMRAPLDAWVTRQRHAGHTAHWRDIRGDGYAALLERARQAQLVVIETSRRPDRHERTRLETVLRRAHRPVLVPGPSMENTIENRIAIAWDGTPVTLDAARIWAKIDATHLVVIPMGKTPAWDDTMPPASHTLPSVPDIETAIAHAADAGAQMLILRAPEHLAASWLAKPQLALLLVPHEAAPRPQA